MTDVDVIYIALCIVALLLALNLLLTFSLAKRLDNAGILVTPPQHVALKDTVVNPFIANRLTDKAMVSLPHDLQPAVWLFLSSQCPKCHDTLPVLERLLPLCASAQVSLQLLTMESRKPMLHFLAGSALLKSSFVLRRKDYLKLNPALVSPGYLFINHEGLVEAEGIIGDTNWQSFEQQLMIAESTIEAGAA